jgi:hypothetical protein
LDEILRGAWRGLRARSERAQSKNANTQKRKNTHGENLLKTFSAAFYLADTEAGNRRSESSGSSGARYFEQWPLRSLTPPLHGRLKEHVLKCLPS